MMSSRSAHDRTLDNVHFAADTNSAPAKKLVRQQTGRWDMAAATGGSSAEGADLNVHFSAERVARRASVLAPPTSPGAAVQLTSADELVAAQAEAAAAVAAAVKAAKPRPPAPSRGAAA